MINKCIIYQFFKGFANHRKKAKRAVVFSYTFSPAFLNTEATDETFQQSGKPDFLRHIWKSSARTYESSGSLFFRTTTRIQSGLDAFDESSLVTAFLTNLGVTEILYSFRLNLEGKTRKEISESSRLEFLQKLLANRFALSYAKDNTSGLIAKSHKWLRIITIFTF